MSDFLQTQPNDRVSLGARRADPSTRTFVRLRAGFYTRYSTSAQHETSTERQTEDCHAYSKRLGFALVEKGIYSDEGRSGGSIVKRDRLHAMLERAEAGDLDVVVIADPSRLSRDMVDLGWLWRTLARAGVALHAANRGRLAAADIALYGFLSQEQRQTITANTAWGRKRMVAEGRVPWGAFYGYRKVAGKRGEIEKHPDQAPIVRRIYELRLQGLSMRDIAQSLNKDCISGPRIDIWKIASVDKVLRQRCYSGVIVYGRRKWETNPDTGRSMRIEKKESDWIIARAPHLEIVSQDEWQRVQDINTEETTYFRGKKGPNRTYLLSGMVRCMHCGGNMVVANSNPNTKNRNMICSQSRTSGICIGSKSINLVAIERAVVEAFECFLSTPDISMAYLKAVSEEGSRYNNDIRSKRAALEAKLSHHRDRLYKTFDEALTEGFRADSLARIRIGIEEKISILEQELERMPLIKRDFDLEKEIIGFGTLNDALKELRSDGVLDVRTLHGARVMVAMRALIDHVVAMPIGKNRGVQVTVKLSHRITDEMAGQEEIASLFEITGSGHPPTRLELWQRIGRKQVQKALSEGNCYLDNDTWDMISHLVEECHYKHLIGNMRNPRELINAMLLSSRLTHPFAELPEKYGPLWRFRNAVRSLKRSGAWKSIYHVLATEAPRFVDGMISHIDFEAPTKPLFGRKPRDGSVAFENPIKAADSGRPAASRPLLSSS